MRTHRWKLVQRAREIQKLMLPTLFAVLVLFFEYPLLVSFAVQACGDRCTELSRPARTCRDVTCPRPLLAAHRDQVPGNCEMWSLQNYMNHTFPHGNEKCAKSCKSTNALDQILVPLCSTLVKGGVLGKLICAIKEQLCVFSVLHLMLLYLLCCGPTTERT